MLPTILMMLIIGGAGAAEQRDKKTVSIAAVGDFGVHRQGTAQVAAMIDSWEPLDCVIAMGDNVYDQHEVSHENLVGHYYGKYISRSSSPDSEPSPRNRFWPVIGNHDWERINWAESHGDINRLPHVRYFRDVVPRGPGGHGLYYDVVVGPVHLIMLDSDSHQPDGVHVGSRQAQWAERTLRASTSPHRVVVFHHTPYTSKVDYRYRVMRWPFAQWGATLVLNGHVHWYERLQDSTGLNYVTNGLGGTDFLYFTDNFCQESKAYHAGVNGAQRITANETLLTSSFVNVRGEVLDTIHIPASPRAQHDPRPGSGDL